MAGVTNEKCFGQRDLSESSRARLEEEEERKPKEMGAKKQK